MAGAPAVVAGPRPAVSFPLPARRRLFSLSPRLAGPRSVLPDPPYGGRPGTYGSGRSAGLGGGEPPGGWKELRFGGRPGPAAVAAFLRPGLGGCVRGFRVALRPLPPSFLHPLAQRRGPASRRVPPPPLLAGSPAAVRSPAVPRRCALSPPAHGLPAPPGGSGVSRVPGVAPRCRVLGEARCGSRPPVSSAASLRCVSVPR